VIIQTEISSLFTASPAVPEAASGGRVPACERTAGQNRLDKAVEDHVLQPPHPVLDATDNTAPAVGLDHHDAGGCDGAVRKRTWAVGEDAPSGDCEPPGDHGTGGVDDEAFGGELAREDGDGDGVAVTGAVGDVAVRCAGVTEPVGVAEAGAVAVGDADGADGVAYGLAVRDGAGLDDRGPTVPPVSDVPEPRERVTIAATGLRAASSNVTITAPDRTNTARALADSARYGMLRW
jgi:hypothetical protein